jgi:predicted NAD/FAD-binding protein
MHAHAERRKTIAVIGSGISGLSAAWLLSKAHDVTLYESDGRLGGHANTVDVAEGGRSLPVDTGFIVFNRATYPNLCALLDHFGIASQETEMSFAVSLDDGRLEYSGTSLRGLFAQRRNIWSPRFWSMLQDLLRFYRRAPRDIAHFGGRLLSLGDYLDAGGYGKPFRDDHLLPMAGAIWSAPCAEILSYPASAFIRFHDNHGLLKLSGRPAWRTVAGGSRSYVERLRADFDGAVETGEPVRRVVRHADGVLVEGARGWMRRFDEVVIAAHANDALAMLDRPTEEETALLSAFRYSENVAVLHSDAALMPRRRAAWSSWNHLGDRQASGEPCSVTYWMNRLQNLDTDKPYFVTLNPRRRPRAETVIRTETYRHPIFDAAALSAQARLWSLQGANRVWFCGAYFGAGFHEDGLQSGLAAAEQLGGVRRPWQVAMESGRIRLPRPEPALDAAA